MEWCGLDSSGTERGKVASCDERGNELSGSIKCCEFRDQVRKCERLVTDCVL
jgi:hypothetical protein